MSEAIGLPSKGEKWFKNSRIKESHGASLLHPKILTVVKKVFLSPQLNLGGITYC